MVQGWEVFSLYGRGGTRSRQTIFGYCWAQRKTRTYFTKRKNPTKFNALGITIDWMGSRYAATILHPRVSKKSPRTILCLGTASARKEKEPNPYTPPAHRFGFYLR